FCFVEKKKCWIRDSKHGYVEAEVKGSGNDGKAIVETTDGKVSLAVNSDLKDSEASCVWMKKEG
uniref:Myosin N-terminal SH3-like domain-containing protein n=1 Tax=Mustela putorius furo TaxID=9669 RepID=M3YF19_MUSPF